VGKAQNQSSSTSLDPALKVDLQELQVASDEAVQPNDSKI
jgi:hypothetical protein